MIGNNPNTLVIKKPQGFFRLIAMLTSIVFAITIFLLVATSCSSKQKINVNLTKNEKYLFGIGSYGKAPNSFVSHEQYFNLGLMTNWYSSTNDIDLLAYMMYRYACLTYGTTNQKSWHLIGKGNVNIKNASGKLTASGYRYEKRRGDTMLADTVLQNVNILSDVSGDAGASLLLEIAKRLVQYGEQRVYMDDYEYILIADNDSFYMDDEYDIAMAKFSNKAKKYDNHARISYKKNLGYVYREYDNDWFDDYGLNSPEKTDHIINIESIIKDSAIITPHTIDGEKYYTVYFEIDTNKTLSTGTTATYYFEQFIINHLDLIDNAPLSIEVSVKYNSLAITMEIWDSGYLRSWKTDENWTVNAALGGFVNIPCTTDISTIEYYSYDPKDNLFDQKLDALKNNNIYVNHDGSEIELLKKAT